jgi:hypothetical protein
MCFYLFLTCVNFFINFSFVIIYFDQFLINLIYLQLILIRYFSFNLIYFVNFVEIEDDFMVF